MPQSQHLRRTYQLPPLNLNVTSDICRTLRNCGAGASSGSRTRRIMQQVQGHCSHATSALFQCAPLSSNPANTPNFTACVNLCPTAAQPCGFCSEPSVVCAQVCSCRHLSCTSRPAKPRGASATCDAASAWLLSAFCGVLLRKQE